MKALYETLDVRNMAFFEQGSSSFATRDLAEQGCNLLFVICYESPQTAKIRKKPVGKTRNALVSSFYFAKASKDSRFVQDKLLLYVPLHVSTCGGNCKPFCTSLLC
jgi:hypothetical protein